MRATPAIALAATAVAIGAVIGNAGTASAPSRAAVHVAASRGLTVRFPFTQTNMGQQHGMTTTGVEGHGTFSASLGSHARDAALLALVTGIPFPQIARGGSFGARLTLGATGTNTGTVVARFKAPGLGSVCFSFTAKGGRYQPGDSFIPTTGTIKVLGGTGAAARWSATASYSLKAITGAKTQNYTFSGHAQGKLGRKRGLSAACQQVARLVRG